MNSVDRKVLRRALKVAMCAVTKKNTHIPVFGMVQLENNKIEAFNDILGISVEMLAEADTGVTGIIPAEIFESTIDSYSTDLIEMEQRTNEIILKSGNTKARLPVIDTDSWPVWRTFDEEETLAEICISDKLIIGMKKVMLAMPKLDGSSSDMIQQHSGITVTVFKDGTVALNATDRSILTDVRIKGDNVIDFEEDKHSIILSSAFCDAFLSICAAYPEYIGDEGSYIGVYSDFCVASWCDGDIILFSRFIHSSNPMDYSKLVSGFKDKMKSDAVQDIPGGFKDAIDRANLFCKHTSLTKTLFTVDKKQLQLKSGNDTNVVEDSLDLSRNTSYRSFECNPAWIDKALKYCTYVNFSSKDDEDGRFIVFSDAADFIFFVVCTDIEE